MRINVTRSALPPMEEYVEEIRELWDSRWLTNNGIKLRTLEDQLRQYLHTPHALTFVNGHLALECLLRALNLKGKVITTPFTFASTTHALVRCGLKPVFCDIEDEYCTMDPQKVEALITPDTCAILPVHVYGNLCDDQALSAIAKKHGLRLIYDAAHAFGVSKDGISAAQMGDAAMFSFPATTVFHTIEGGCVTTSDPEILHSLEMERSYGIVDETTVSHPGGNFKMNEFQAAMGLCNLRHAEENLALRRHAAETYHSLLGGREDMLLPRMQPGVTHNYAYFPVRFPGEGRRDAAAKKLAEHGVFARKYFYPLTNDFACYENLPGFDSSLTPVARKISGEVLTLPLYPGLSDEEILFIANILKEM